MFCQLTVRYLQQRIVTTSFVMKDKIKYDSFLNGIERLLSKELGKDPQADQKMFDYTMKLVDHL